MKVNFFIVDYADFLESTPGLEKEDIQHIAASQQYFAVGEIAESKQQIFLEHFGDSATDF